MRTGESKKLIMAEIIGKKRFRSKRRIVCSNTFKHIVARKNYFLQAHAIVGGAVNFD